MQLQQVLDDLNKKEPKQGGKKQHATSNTTKASVRKGYDKTKIREFPVFTVSPNLRKEPG
jgi:hypothetical protein